MADMTLRTSAKVLFFIPSFYGAAAWGIWLTLYLMKLVSLDDCGVVALGIFLLVEVFFLLSTFVSLPCYRQALISIEARPATEAPAVPGRLSGTRAGLYLLHGIGFLGLVQYVNEFSKNLGGITGFLLTLVSEAYAIRWEAETSASIGTQLSYFGWIAIALTVYQYSRKKVSGYWLVTAFVQYLGNFLFIDRTRPFWILFTSMIIILPAVRSLDIKRIARWSAGSCLVALLFFWLIAEWTGKTAYEGKYEKSVLPGISQEIYAYGVSGFAYFNRMLENNEQLSYMPERSLYPALKFLTRFGISAEPPRQILDFYDVPFSTNVGSFLEPYYRDGGLLFVLCGIIIYSFGIDALALRLLNSGNPLATYAWANLCFVTAMCFYNPMVNFFPTWLFTGLGILGICVESARDATARPGVIEGADR